MSRKRMPQREFTVNLVPPKKHQSKPLITRKPKLKKKFAQRKRNPMNSLIKSIENTEGWHSQITKTEE